MLDGMGCSIRNPSGFQPQFLIPHFSFLIQNDGGVLIHSTLQAPLPALTSLWGAVGRK